jgi:hypothetical protein
MSLTGTTGTRAGSKLFLLQQRAPAIPGRQAAFCSDLARWLAASGAGQVRAQRCWCAKLLMFWL